MHSFRAVIIIIKVVIVLVSRAAPPARSVLFKLLFKLLRLMRDKNS
jgi:hypothetical protein